MRRKAPVPFGKGPTEKDPNHGHLAGGLLHSGRGPLEKDLPIAGTSPMAYRCPVRPYLTLRVVPASLGAHAAMAGSFKLMEFAEFRPVTYLESTTSSLFLERRDEATAYRSILGALAHTALDEGQSRELIATLATELFADREDHHDRA